MTGVDDTDDRPELTPPDIDHRHLPDRTMYEFGLDRASHSGRKRDEVRTHLLFVTNEFTFLDPTHPRGHGR